VNWLIEPPVQLAGRHELVAGLQESVKDHHLRGVAGGDG
jgi:hypothetical protein